MEKKVLLKELVDSGTNIRREFIPKAVVSDKGKYQIGEFWDANKTIDVIVNNSHQQHDNIRELDEFAHHLDDIKVGKISVSDVLDLTNEDINNLKTGDVVVKQGTNNTYAYEVTRKNDNEMSLVYVDHEKIEEITYELVQSTEDPEEYNWQYKQTDILDIPEVYTKTEIDDRFNDVLGVNAEDITALKALVEDLDDTTGILTTLNEKQDNLVSGTNIKTIGGQSILGQGNIDVQAIIKANESFPASWDTSHTMADLIEDINNDPSAVPGKVYLDTVSVNDLPDNSMMQAEMTVQVMSGSGNRKVLLFTVTSENVSPYRWEYTSAYGRHGDWRSWMTSDSSYTKSQIDQMIQNAGSGDTPSYVETTPHVFLTQAEYDAIQNVNQDAIYFILEPEPGAGFPLQFPITLA